MEPVRTKLRSVRAALRFLLCFFAIIALAERSFGGPQINPACPLNFFTNVASRLLSSQLNLNLTGIQIYPTNQYTPAVHRLLQVTANIYDATTTNYYPSVFRPLFWKTNEVSNGSTQTCIYIAGYQYVQEPLPAGGPSIFNTPLDVTDPNVPFGLSGFTNNIYGIPWVLGAKKGLPNFNGLEIENYFYIQRELQFNRQNTDVLPSSSSFGQIAAARGLTTNQMYLIGVSNAIGIEDWNSYATTYTNSVAVFAEDVFSFGLSNDAPNFVQVNNTFYASNFSTLSLVTDWPGYLASSPGSFFLPLGTNVILQNLAPTGTAPSINGQYVYFYGSGVPSANLNGYNFQAPCFIPTSLNPAPFMDPGIRPLPHLVMTTTNHVQAWILDFGPNGTNGPYILDYVQLGPQNSSLDLNAVIADPTPGTIGLPGNYLGGLWSTNFYNGGGNTPLGVNIQYIVSIGAESVPTPFDADGGFWATTSVPGAGSDTSPTAQAAYFQAFFSYDDAAAYNGGPGYLVNTNLSILAPFTPNRLAFQSMVYQANDPLVHYLTSDLNDFQDDTNGIRTLTLPPPSLKYLGHLSDRYMPWGSTDLLPSVFYYNGVPIPTDQNPYNFSYKDPLVWSSDYWSFPTNETLNASWLGQVHRGTPWQTIFLKSTNVLDMIYQNSPGLNIGFSTWQSWTGDTNLYDSYYMAPVMDWRMAGQLASLFNTNNIASLFSVNDPNPSDWENLLNGMTVLTNDVADAKFNFKLQQLNPEFAALAISSNSSQAAAIANAIETTRIASPGQIIANVGDIFAIPQLSDASPYLNVDSTQTKYGISDLAYEAIPDQFLPLLWEASLGAPGLSGGQMVIQFTGDNNYSYAVQSSCDLVHWTNLSTNCPVNGIFNFTNSATGKARFYRSVLIQ